MVNLTLLFSSNDGFILNRKIWFSQFRCSILDDIEMYEQQDPFQLSDYTGLSYFLNNFLFKTIQDNIFGMF